MSPRLFVPLLVLMLGCTAALSEGLVLTTDRGRYAPGDAVVLTLQNGGDASAGYNLCSSPLERRTAGGWDEVPVDLFCTMELRNLAPGERATFRHTLPATLEAGEYRYVTRVEVRPSGEMRTVATGPFQVR